MILADSHVYIVKLEILEFVPAQSLLVIVVPGYLRWDLDSAKGLTTNHTKTCTDERSICGR